MVVVILEDGGGGGVDYEDEDLEDHLSGGGSN